MKWPSSAAAFFAAAAGEDGGKCAADGNSSALAFNSCRAAVVSIRLYDTFRFGSVLLCCASVRCH